MPTKRFANDPPRVKDPEAVELGRKGGTVRSVAKLVSCRRNAKKLRPSRTLKRLAEIAAQL